MRTTRFRLAAPLALALAAAWATLPSGAASAQEARKYGYTGVSTVVSAEPDASRMVVRDGWSDARIIAVDDATVVQDAHGEALPLSALGPRDRVVVDGRREMEGERQGEKLVADRIQLLVGEPGDARSAPPRYRRDAALRDRIVERLAASRSLQGSDVWVAVSRGHVTLRGLVADEDAKQRALELTRRTPAVRGVTSHLRTDPSLAEWAATKVEDEVLAREVAERLAARAFPDARIEQDWLFGWEVEGESFELDVDADMGTVTLSGTVPASEDVERAITTARGTPGVRNVRASLDHD